MTQDPTEWLNEIMHGNKNALTSKVDSAIKDEAEAWKMYDDMRTAIVTVFPVGTPEYNTFIRIAADEMRHEQDLRHLRAKLETLK